MKLEYSFQYPLFLLKQLRELLRLKKKKEKSKYLNRSTIFHADWCN